MSMMSTAIAQQYERDGFYVAHGLFSSQECAGLKAEALRVLREKARPGATVYVGCAAASPTFYRLASDRRLVDILRQLLPDGVMFLSDKFVFKSGAKTFATPWHYDAAYWRNTRPKLSVWIPLDDANAANGTLKVLPGSHLRAWEHIQPDTSATNNEFDHVIAATQWDPREELVCELARGGAIFFSDRLLHASCPNTAGEDRYTVISTYHAPAADEDFDGQFSARHVIVPAAPGRSVANR